MGTLKIPKVALGKTRPDAPEGKDSAELVRRREDIQNTIPNVEFQHTGKTRPAAPEHVEDPIGPVSKEGISRRDCEVILDRAWETHPDAPEEQCIEVDQAKSEDVPKREGGDSARERAEPSAAAHAGIKSAENTT